MKSAYKAEHYSLLILNYRAPRPDRQGIFLHLVSSSSGL
jgi:hypothetical protein